jgi:putative protease
VQDIALLKLAARLFPDMEVHCSTQMVVHNAEGVRYYTELGAERVVLARELSLEEIKHIVSSTGADIEVFVHGALCVSYSGQCLMSSLIGGRSGNRGRCAQPCRKKYSYYNFSTGKAEPEHQGKHLMSTRDLNTYNRLEELAAAGVTSLKIEGRMKKPEYVAVVVKHYREALDRIMRKDNSRSMEAEYELKSAFNREFTEGYIFNKRNKDIVSIERPDNRGVKLGRVVRSKGDMTLINIEEGTLNDGDGIEIESPDGRNAGTIISGIRVKGENVKSAVKGDTAEIFLREKVAAGSRVNKTFDSVLARKAREEYSPQNRRKIPVECRLILKVGEYPVIIVKDKDGNTVSYTDTERVEQAQKSAATLEKVSEQLGKTGDTPYMIKVTEAEMGEGCFLPASQLNRLRREVLQLLTKKREASGKRPAVEFNPSQAISGLMGDSGKGVKAPIELIAGVRNKEAAKSALASGADTIYLLSDAYEGDIEADSLQLAESCKSLGRSLFHVLPNIIRERELAVIQGRLERIISQTGTKSIGLVISGPGQLGLVKALGIEKLRTNYTLNIFNSAAAEHYAGEGAEAVGLSPELNLPQIRAISSRSSVPLEAVVYGYMPVMTTEYCPVSMLKNSCGNERGCNSSNYGIIDEKGKIFRVVSLGGCRTQLLNSNILLLAEELGAIAESGVSKLRADFYFEAPEEVSRIIKLYKSFGNFDKKDMLLIEQLKDKGFTKGHFYRGVE